MIIDREGETFNYNGVTYTIGSPIIGTKQSEYEGLKGYIFEIRDGEDKDTENTTPDLYCCFEPPLDPEGISRIEAIFSDLYDEPKTVDDIIFDSVIMAPEMVAPLKTYHIPVVWSAWGVLTVEAPSLEQATKIAINDKPIPNEQNYIEDSMQVDWGSVPGITENIETGSNDECYLEEMLGSVDCEACA